MSNTKTYYTWVGMRERCENPEHVSYHNYGAKGVTVCAEWQKFQNFLDDMGEKPEGKTLDRLHNDKGYSKDNCKWSTPTEQGTNMSRNVRYTVNGVTKTQVEWARHLGVHEATIAYRVKKWGDVARACTEAPKDVGMRKYITTGGLS